MTDEYIIAYIIFSFFLLALFIRLCYNVNKIRGNQGRILTILTKSYINNGGELEEWESKYLNNH